MVLLGKVYPMSGLVRPNVLYTRDTARGGASAKENSRLWENKSIYAFIDDKKINKRTRSQFLGRRSLSRAWARGYQGVSLRTFVPTINRRDQRRTKPPLVCHTWRKAKNATQKYAPICVVDSVVLHYPGATIRQTFICFVLLIPGFRSL